MPANSRVFLKPFIGGLNTEGSDTDDMVLNTSDELNCTILPEQMRGRRYGFNIEKDGKWIDSGEDIVAHSLYHWNNVYENVNYIVVQINDKIYIYPDVKPHSQQTYLTRIDLSQYATLSVIEPVSMTSVSSSLFVVGRWIKPIVIEKEPDTDVFTVSINNPKFRDFNGVEDGYAVDYLPSASEGLTNRHKYNLINQGWDKEIFNPTDNTRKTLLPDGFGYEGLFFTEYADEYGVGAYPANNMQWFLGKQNSGEYNTTDLLNTYFGNTPAPKGHFIIDYLNRDRSAVSGIALDDEPAQTGVNYDTTIPVNNSRGNTKWEMACRLYFGFNHPETYLSIPLDYKISYALPTNISGTLTKFSWGLKDFCQDVDFNGAVSPDPDHIVNNALRSDADIKDLYIFCQPFTMSLIGVTGNGTEVEIASQEIQLTGKMFTADGWDFTVVNTSSYVRYEIRLTWPSLDRSHKWLVPDSLNETFVINEINYDETSQDSYEGLPSSDLLRGAITDIESFGGRLFYLCGNTVLFSQTLSTNNKNFDKCYQEADPTSEEVSDVVATDGGMIQLLSLGHGKALKRFYRGILVFGDEEVTGILSNSINLFSAESYDVVKITSAGLCGKYSVVETDSNVFYWSNHGIYIVGIDDNNNISSVCISLNTIQNWYNNLSQVSRDNCVGYYDYANNRIYWFYPTTNNIDKLDGCLIYDLTFNCFMPQYIDSGKVIRDPLGNFAGILNNYNNIFTRNGKEYKCSVINNAVFDLDNNLLGYIQNKYLTDCQESSSVYEIEPTVYLRAGGDRVVAGDYKVLATSGKDAGFNRKSAGLFLISDGTNFSFGDFNDREFHDWDISPYESYVVSRPITLGDTYFNKQTPVMQTLFKRTEEYKLKDRNDFTIYNLNNVFEQLSAGERTTNTYLYNAGKITKASITFDLTNYSQPDIIHVVRGQIFGYDDDPLDTTLVASATKYPDINGGKYRLDLEILPTANTVFKHYNITAQAGPQLGTTMDRVISTVTYIEFDKYDITEPMFSGFEELTFEGNIKLNKTTNTRFSGYINIPQGFLKNASVTYEPSITQYFDPVPGVDTTWTASAGFVPYATPVTVTDSSPTADATYTAHTLYDQFGMLLDNLIISGPGVLYNDTVFARYKVTTLSPKYETYSSIIPFEYTTPSGAIIRMRWGWSVNPLSNRWDMMQNGYRPQKDFLHDDYVESRLHIRGRGKAFQVEIRNDDNKDFRLTGLNIITRSPQ